MIALILAAFAAQDDLTVLRPDEDPKKMLYKHLQAACGAHFAERKKAVAALKTPAEVAARQETLRKKFVAALGGWAEKTPLNARVAGTARKDGYSIERVIYESRPNHHVTATLYLPEGKPPFPGVLFPCGHFNNAKTAKTYQQACSLLAKNGIAALCFDPISQGERVQLLTSDGKPAAGYGTGEHTHLGIAALLAGQCAATYLVWDSVRSLDYLAGRPEIDPKRLGCWGNSGGGTQTSYLMALDERVACAVPNCYITSLERLFATIGPQDAEQNIPGQVAFGMEHADYVTMRAPKPTLISATTRDFFDIDGVWQTYREAKLLYGLLGYGERVDVSEIDDKHAISKPVREAGLRWFRRWLLDKDDAATEPDFPVATDEELQCTKSGQVVRDLGGRTAFDFVRERAEALAAARKKIGREEFRAEVRRRAAVGAPGKLASAQRGTIQRDGYGLVKVAYEREGMKLPALHLLPKEGAGRNPLIVYLNSAGKAAEPGRLEKWARQGRAVVAVDLRGWGETAPAPPPKGTSPFSAEWKEAFLGVHLERPLLGQRVGDLLALVEHLSEASPAGIEIVAVGAASPSALHAAALDARITSLTLEGGLVSWMEVVRKPVGMGQLANVVPGALEAYDLPDLAAALAPRPLELVRPVDPAGQPVPRAEVDSAYAAARAAYAAAGAESALRITSP